MMENVTVFVLFLFFAFPFLILGIIFLTIASALGIVSNKRAGNFLGCGLICSVPILIVCAVAVLYDYAIPAYRYIIPLNVIDTHASPNNQYKAVIKEGSRKHYPFLLIKNNNYFPNYYVYSRIPIPTDILWSEDSKQVAIWRNELLLYAYDIENKKRLNEEDNIPKPDGN